MVLIETMWWIIVLLFEILLVYVLGICVIFLGCCILANIIDFLKGVAIGISSQINKKDK